MPNIFLKAGVLVAFSGVLIQACSGSDTVPAAGGCIANQPIVCDCPSGKASNGLTVCKPDDSTVYVSCDCGVSTTTTTSTSSSSSGMQPTCKATEIVCTGKCVNPMNDDANCGMCATKCPKVTACLAGSCQCLLAGQKYCGGDCLDVSADEANCGGCGHDCKGAACLGGVCTPTKLAANQDAPFGLAVDKDYVYWSSAGVTNSIFRKKLADATAPQLVAMNQKLPHDVALATDAKFTGVLWANAGLADQGAAIVGAKVPLMPVTLATSMKDTVYAMVVVGSKVFWLNQKMGEVWSADFTATVDTTNLKLAASLSLPWDIAANAAFVYYSSYNGGDIRRVGSSGGIQKVLVKGLGNPTGIAIDATYVYYATENAGEIARVIQDGSKPPESIATNQLKPAQVALDAEFVYWTNYGTSDTDGSVAKAPLAGGDVIVLAAAQNKPYQIAVDEAFVYWTTLDGKTIMKAPK